MIALLAALAAVATPPDELSAAIDAAVRPLAARVAALEEGLAALQKENALLKARAPVQRSISVAGGDDEAGAGRRLSSDPDGCCRWDAAGSCTGVASARMQQCTLTFRWSRPGPPQAPPMTSFRSCTPRSASTRERCLGGADPWARIRGKSRART